MKSISTFIIILLSTTILSAQCMIEPWTLEKRIYNSTLIVEAKVIKKECTLDKSNGSIFTINTLEVYRSFKGNSVKNEIKLVTEGGQVGDKMLRVSPSLQVALGETGIFLLKESTTLFENHTDLWRATASVQSFIKYDLAKVLAFDFGKIYSSILYDLYDDIKIHIDGEVKTIKSFDPEAGNKRIRALAPPVINSLSMSPSTSGTGSVLTISGSNFGFAQGSGKVGFKDANFGDGRYYYSPTTWVYNSWSNTEIKVVVPTRAGTGKVEVTNNAGESGESNTDLTIDWAHLNVQFPSSSSSSPFFEIQHTNVNGSGGYTWSPSTEFAINSAASESFTRSLNEWKCETQMNWGISSSTVIDTALRDGTNIVEFTSFGDSRLGVCRSYYSGCGSGSNYDWHVAELDISFERTTNWYYGTASPTSNQFDFESVATHELGHGHQLGHVRDNSKVMHYSISNGQRKPNLVTTDIAAGNYVRNKSTSSSVCSRGLMTNGICPTIPPTADFTISDNSICPNTNTTITNASTGTNITSLVWNFGEGANPPTGLGVGPFTVSYNASGTKSIELIVTNVNGSDTITKNVTVLPTAIDTPNTFVLEDSTCPEVVRYDIDPVSGATGYRWSLASGGNIIEDGFTYIRVNWQDSGLHTISVFARGVCGDGDPREEQVYVLADPVADFTSIENGLTATFTNNSSYGESYSWNFGDGNTSTETNPVHKYGDKGEYQVSLSATNRCGGSETNEDVLVAFGANVLEIKKVLTIYPNPVRVGSKISIKEGSFTSFAIYNAEGKLVQSGDLLGESIVLNNSSAGVFVLVLQEADRVVRHKITVIE